MAGSKIFFSYAREDSEFAKQLATDLRKAGADIWMDQLDIRAGSRWDVEIEKALQSGESLLVILTSDSVSSHNVSDEISYAFDENKNVIPVLFKECKIPFRLRRLQYADFTKEYEKGFAELLRGLNLSPDPGNKIEKEKESDAAAQAHVMAILKKKKEQILQQKNIVPDKKDSKPVTEVKKLNKQKDNITNKAVVKKETVKKEKERVTERMNLLKFGDIDYSYDRKKNEASEHGDLIINSQSIEFATIIPKEALLITEITDISFVKATAGIYNNYIKVSFFKGTTLSVIYFMRFTFFWGFLESPTLEMYNQIQELITKKKFILFKKQ